MRNLGLISKIIFIFSWIFFTGLLGNSAEVMRATNSKLGIAAANNSSLLPIAKDTTLSFQGGTLDDLFPIRNPIVNNQINDGSNKGSNSNSGNGNSSRPSIGIPGSGNNGGFKPPGNSNGKTGNSTGSNNNNNNNDIEIAKVSEQFQCNLFENPDYDEIISSLNALDNAARSSSCGDSKVSSQTIVDNNQKIRDAVTKLKDYVSNPDSVTEDKVPDLTNQVDVAIRAASNVAQTFSSSDLFNSKCRQSMSNGDVALAINDVLNGLTPYAMMAATMSGGTAAVPYIVGGTVITGAVASISKIIMENRINIEDPSVRRAIVTNMCQFIRVDQKYKFLIKGRSEQIRQISKEIADSQKQFSVKRASFSVQTNNLMDQSGALNQISKEVAADNSSLRYSIDSDKKFLETNLDPSVTCQLGIQLAAQRKNQEHYIYVVTNNANRVVLATNGVQSAQSKALSSAIAVALRALTLTSEQQNQNKQLSYQRCAANTRTLVNSVSQLADLTQFILQNAQSNMDRQISEASDFKQIKKESDTLKKKSTLANTVVKSLDNLRKFADTITQSEIDAQIEDVRAGLIMNSRSPVITWFNYILENKYQNAVAAFNRGLADLRRIAYRYTESGKVNLYYSILNTREAQDRVLRDQKIAQNLANFNIDAMPIGSEEYTKACREMQGVYSHWIAAFDHLRSVEAFCSMISPYIYDTRPSDKELVALCRGETLPNNVHIDSRVKVLKMTLRREHTAEWAVSIQKKLDDMLCPSAGSFQ